MHSEVLLCSKFWASFFGTRGLSRPWSMNSDGVNLVRRTASMSRTRQNDKLRRCAGSSDIKAQSGPESMIAPEAEKPSRRCHGKSRMVACICHLPFPALGCLLDWIPNGDNHWHLLWVSPLLRTITCLFYLMLMTAMRWALSLIFRGVNWGALAV